MIVTSATDPTEEVKVEGAIALLIGAAIGTAFAPGGAVAATNGPESAAGIAYVGQSASGTDLSFDEGTGPMNLTNSPAVAEKSLLFSPMARGSRSPWKGAGSGSWTATAGVPFAHALFSPLRPPYGYGWRMRRRPPDA
jgi:hypothetical protein